ncbi:MAG: carboxypeptidase regulatory-like domain-containing protein [Myxococcales bacterium]|nr:carboxypeptidase regulatory-like domain-containing protein [Myxococcales bacterium]
MSPDSHSSPRTLKAAAVLFLVVGTLGGGLGGATMGFLLGRSARQPSPSVGDAGTSTPRGRSPDAGRVIASRPDLGPHADASVAASLDLGSKNPDPSGALVCVEVRDVGERRVAGALITWRSVVPSSLRPTSQVGELGVYSAPLPFPDEVIARGGVPASGAVAVASGRGAPSTLRSDAQGRACLRASGHMILAAALDERSASVELDLSSSGQSPGVIILRLAIPADALCHLASPSESVEAGGDPVSSQPASDIEGRVVDSRGFGISGVRIDGQVGGSQATALSDARGSFRLIGLPRGSLSLRAQKRGYAPLRSSRRADEPRSEIALSLDPGGGIAGLLRDRQRGLVPTAASLSLDIAGTSQPVPLARDGQFSLTGLPPGPAILRARAPGFASLSLPIDIPAGHSPDEITLRDLRVELVAGATVAGRVRSGGGTPAGVSIRAIAEDGSILARTLTDERGEFQLSDLPAGRLQITATAGAHSGSVRVDVQAGRHEQIQIELQE